MRHNKYSNFEITMESTKKPNGPSDFLQFCGKDIADFNKESDASEKSHLLRRINAQMYAEACKQ